MTPTALVAGSIDDEACLVIAHAPGDNVSVRISYPLGAPSNSYPLRVEPRRLSATLRPTEQGWVARAAALNALGYGSTHAEALDDLADSIEQYLEFLRDDAPRLAPAVAHHATYVQLLRAPRAVWFASVDAPTVE